MAGRWADTRPEQAAAWLAASPVQWWIVGGWALDLWLGRQTRVHRDIEVGCFRDDLSALLVGFADWDVQVARQKRLTPYDSEATPAPPFSIWLRRPGRILWDLELLVEERSGDVWRYRRDERITLPLSRLVVPDRTGTLPVIAPEVQLLYKAKDMREKDAIDFLTVLPHLSAASRDWLRQSLIVAHPGHQWLARLDAAAL